MRTTIGLEKLVLEEAKKQALAEHVSLNKYIESALQEKLAMSAADKSYEYRPLPTFSGDGLQKGIDLNDSASLNALDDQ